jgi:hypothetical protein
MKMLAAEIQQILITNINNHHTMEKKPPLWLVIGTLVSLK